MIDARTVARIARRERWLALALAALVPVTALAAAEQGGALDTSEKKLSYALGQVLGNQFRDQRVEVDLELYMRGLRDALSGGGTLLSPSEARAAVNQLQGRLKQGRSAPRATPAAAEIAVSFRLDPRLTRSMYMGDRWVSPPTYSRVQEGDALVVEARAEPRDPRGRALDAHPTWETGDADLIQVDPPQGREVRLTVLREGRTDLTLTAGKASRKLSVEALRRDGRLQVNITQ
jgi:hypothetical protein